LEENFGGNGIKAIKRTSLAEELLRITYIIFFTLFISISGILYFLAEFKIIPSLLIGAGFSLIFTSFCIYLFKSKLEEILGKLLYITTTIAENKEKIEELIIPFPIQEELEDIIKNVEEVLTEIKRNCDRKVKDLELEYVPMVEKSGELIRQLERLKSGYLSLEEVPVGLDPVGAMGLALKESMEEIQERINRIKELSTVLEGELKELKIFIEEGAETGIVEKKLALLESIIINLKKELAFFK